MSKARLTTAVVVAAAFMAAAPGTAPAASDQAGCVGTYSSHYAQQGMRDEVAQLYSKGNQPYSFVAQFHGDLEACDEQVH
jgi:hypothetical protein